MRLLFLLTAFLTVSCEPDNTAGQGSQPTQPVNYYGIAPPSFTMDQNLTLFKRTTLLIGFGVLILLNFFDMSGSKKYRLPLLKATGLSICMYELVLRKYFDTLLFTILVALFTVTFIFSFHKGLIPLINSISSSYTSCMLFCTLFAIQSPPFFIVSVIMYAIITLFVLKHIISLFDYLVGVSINTFLACCMLEMTFFAIFTKGLTLPYGAFNPGFLLSKFILISLIALFAFIGPIISFFTGRSSEKSKPTRDGEHV